MQFVDIEEVLLDACIPQSRIVVEKLDKGEDISLDDDGEASLRRKFGIPLSS